MHQRFMHPSPGKLFNLIKRAKPEKANAQLLKILQEISIACQACAPYTVPPFRFRTTIPPDEIVFNRELAMDLMYLNKKPVLHVIDTATNFQNAVFIRSKSTEDL